MKRTLTVACVILKSAWQPVSLRSALAALLLIASLDLAGSVHGAEPFEAFLEKHCFRCHGEAGKVKGKVNLLERSTQGDFLSHPELLTDLIRVVKDREMPPEDEPQLSASVQETLLANLNALLTESLKTSATVPRTPVRRMNRFQYANAVEDLLDLKVELFALPERVVREYDGYFQPASGKMPNTVRVGNRPLGKSQLIAPRLNGVAPFPQDRRAEHGFDNRADLITLSPLLMESFLTLSRSIVHSPDFGPATCGIWKSFFAEPTPQKDVPNVIHQRLDRFLTRAFRGPVERDVVKRYAAHAITAIEGGASFTHTMKEAVAAVLISPRFLYLNEAATGAAPEPLTDHELASRLSYFLWGSLPDEILLALADEGKLRDPAILAAQAARLMNDRRMKRFCDSFPAQWLKIEHLIASEPKPAEFKHYYWGRFAQGSNHMMLEPLLVFEAVFIENRPILDLIHSDFTYRSKPLDAFYRRKPTGVVTPLDTKFHRVPVASKREGGVITNGAIMTMTSNATRTQPITRGAWVVEVIFNNPPPPPPADVPPLDEEAKGPSAQNLTIREKLIAHATRADCRSCHAKIDPYGFALEHYDPVGLWRDTYEDGQPIDASGLLFNQRPFKTIEEFKDGLLAEKNRFTRAVATHLLAYALGREVKAADHAALDRIVTATAADGYRLRSLLTHVVLSEPFQTKFHPTE
jgi:hypothetical protein